MGTVLPNQIFYENPEICDSFSCNIFDLNDYMTLYITKEKTDRCLGCNFCTRDLELLCTLENTWKKCLNCFYDNSCYMHWISIKHLQELYSIEG